jgi:hypothetical protein
MNSKQMQVVAQRSTTSTLTFANHVASKLARQSSQAVTLARKLVLNSKCPSCQAELRAPQKKRFCRRCGNVFCEACTQQRAKLVEYHSRFGVLTNRTNKTMHVCKACYAASTHSHQSLPAAASPGLTRGGKRAEAPSPAGAEQASPQAEGRHRRGARGVARVCSLEGRGA